MKLNFFFAKLLGLCHNNLIQTPGEKLATTSQDLQGFWDMLLLQVDHMDSIFAEIEELKRNNWQVSYTIQLLDTIYFFFFEIIMEYCVVVVSCFISSLTLVMHT